ncbi:MAG: transcription-repair coupling factor, partial [Nitrospirae bacterium]|nr:transcription-repair coupling factor [Nitrospirota bacterium]
MPFNFSIFYNAAHLLEERKVKGFTSLQGSSGALLFALITKPCLLVCPSENSAAEFYSDAVFWARALKAGEPLLIQGQEDPLRLKNLKNFYEKNNTGIITSVDAALSPTWKLDGFPLIEIMKNTEINRDSLIERLKDSGYHPVSVVSAEGDLSVRGGIVDVFPPGEEFPVRVEFFGDSVESLRFFDTGTQRSVKEIEQISIGPSAEPDKGPCLLDALSGRILILNEPDDTKRQNPGFIQAVQSQEPVCFTSLPLQGEGFDLNISGTGGFGLLREERASLEDFVKRAGELKQKYFIMTVCPSAGQAKRLRELFSEKEIEAPVLSSDTAVKYSRSPVITTGELSRGFAFKEIIVLTERDIFGERPAFKPVKQSKISQLLSSTEELQEGDYLVHKQHGIGRFLCIQRQRVGDYEGDFLIIEYLSGGKLHIPLERIDQIQKYHGPEGVIPKMDKLGGRTWQKTKQKVSDRIRDMAEKLLKLYARRTSDKGFGFSADTELHKEFDGFFPYEETPDQITAVSGIKQDMEEPAPMDRLLCGDVGYGKTEVAMRACFKAVYDSMQAAVIAPTTILVEQHYNTFTARFSAFPVRIDFLSRFKSKAEQTQTLKALAAGEIDIIIGTHRLLAKDVTFHNLGLLVIDEEHRFGVTHKEKLKTLKTNVDVLSLTATPIPRTLHMALSGIRQMSVIETAPEERLAVKSFVVRFGAQVIKDSLQKELQRGGQAFFVHNRIEDIYKMAKFISELLPESKAAVAHGRMSEKELEGVMRSFITKKADILVSTAIISSGLDIPNANTIIINMADKFGLADLYQLKGRVGRSNVRAYAYFLIPGEDAITEGARKKLLAIQEMSYLGAGFRLALKDLELRGSGNLLGPEQSGHIEAVGFDLYIEMLEQAVSELKGEEAPPVIEPFLDLNIPAMIPESYIEDPTLRLSVYRKIASAKHTGALIGILTEMKDRFGKPPERTLRLLEVMELKLAAKKFSIVRIQNTNGKIKIIFTSETGAAPQKIFNLYRGREKYLKFLEAGGIELDLRGKTWEEIFW